jgi:hypothetical protein
MAKEAKNTGRRREIPWRIAAWGTAALLLLLPLVANAPWTASDFVFMGVLLGSLGLAFELAVRKGNAAYRMGTGAALAATFLLVWVNGAAGMIGSEYNRFNLLFGGVLAVALIGAILARFEPVGMARAMVAAAIAQAVVGAFGLSADVRGGVLSVGFAGLWLLAAALFRNAARDQRHRREA